MSVPESCFRYYQVKVAAKTLPGSFRIDPLAVVFTGGAGGYAELGRTEKRMNEWNPQFSTAVVLPADTDAERAADIRVDFYNKTVSEDRFVGTASCSFYQLIEAAGAPLVLPLRTPTAADGDPKARVMLLATEGYRSPTSDATKSVRLSLEMEQTNFYGVQMTAYYELSRSTGATWTPSFTSKHAKIDAQGWVQFDTSSISLTDLAQDNTSMPLMLCLYRHKLFGPRRLLGRMQFSLDQVLRMQPGEFLTFIGNEREILLAADCAVQYARCNGSIYDVSLKFVNVRWRADSIPNPNDT